MRIKFSQKLATLTPGDVSAVIQMAWEDRTSFESIKERVGLSESDVVRLMRHELSPSSYQLWRTRMKGRVTKHRALRSPKMKFDDRMIANHRRANC
ncbi:TIGR03643 family protein [Limnohabitans sp. JirII-31]|uniref:TIGR03643 family protein n=1 Tax=Limnohabitans sp. JirII-31 TaxID=1977908 RepID=UPI000C1EFA5A|nr:TIGR03643 family protein [Limnohabitans sp. JirII-31]PIT80734.1 TIGR03643 family protein [Limnohabitans sp. JirII-31]